MSRERQTLFLGAGAILLLTLIAYIPAIGGGFIWDDDFHITNNRALRDLDGLQRIWTDARTTPQYYPLTHTSFWLQYQLWGANPLPYHIANVLLHIASALLLWGVLAKLRMPGAWLAAALFALHPVHVESVAWITERKNVLSGFFYMAAAFTYIRHKLEDRDEGWGPLLALLCYSVTISPALGFFNIFPMRYSFVADHFQYLASIGPLTLIAVLLWRHLPKTLARNAAIILLAACAILTFRQGLAYDGLESLWRQTVRQYDQAFMAHFNLAKLLEKRGDLDEAKRHYLKTIEAKPDHHEAYMDLGNILAGQGDIPAAIERYRQSLLIDPEHALTHYNLALSLEKIGMVDEAMHRYLEAIHIEPELAAAHNNLAIILFNRGDYHGAARQLRLAEEHGGAPHPDFLRELADKMRLLGEQP